MSLLELFLPEDLSLFLEFDFECFFFDSFDFYSDIQTSLNYKNKDKSSGKKCPKRDISDSGTDFDLSETKSPPKRDQ